MHKRNITLTALVLAAIITCAFVFFQGPNHSNVIGILYFPAILLSVIFSGGHSPSAVAGWSSFIIYTLFYWVVFLVVYVLLLEIYLLRQILHHLDDAKHNLISEQADSKMALEKIGHAIAELETRRRKHFLLQPIDLDLSEAPHLLAAKAISRAGKTRPVSGILRKLEAKIRTEKSPLQAAIILSDLRKEAETIAAGNQASTS